MFVEPIVKFVDRLTLIHGRDNFTERVVHSFTIWIFIFFTCLLSSKLLFGKLLVCQAPAESPDSWVNYYHDYCYYQDKYRQENWRAEQLTPTFAEINKNRRDKDLVLRYSAEDTDIITYYQWIPYVMMLQVLICLVPSLFWSHVGLRWFHGNDFDAVLKGFVAKVATAESEKVCERYLSDDQWKRVAKDAHRLLKIKKRDRFGLHSTMIVYVITKWLSFFCALIQFWIMAGLYADASFFWGFHLTYEIINGVTKDLASGLFPRVVQCHVARTALGTVQGQELHCLLTQNFINEKVFLFLYWWIMFTLCITFISAFRFTMLLLIPAYQRYTTKSLIPTQEYFLEVAGGQGQSPTSTNCDLLEYFIDYLGTQINPTAPPMDVHDGGGDMRSSTGKEKNKKKSLSQLKKDMDELKKRLASINIEEEQNDETRPLISEDPSSSSSRTPSPPMVQNFPNDEVFNESELAENS
ncbi:unnamed protein product [Caenorhabditis bovis]|uniref:Innexin n=1 Tax=Caenorhabditis bovis TaxID=2654633 RepID=A0A8S1EZE7_9PELO|nr:unnamed protein product [Caenorhabditis bovis]